MNIEDCHFCGGLVGNRSVHLEYHWKRDDFRPRGVARITNEVLCDGVDYQTCMNDAKWRADGVNVCHDHLWEHLQ